MGAVGNKTPTGLRIPKQIWSSMDRDVRQRSLEEACGLLAGVDHEVSEVYPITNSLHSPVRFYMQPEELLSAFAHMEERGWEALAIYHSHLKGPSVPSETDIAEFRYPGTLSLIWSPARGQWICRAFLIEGQGYVEAPVVVLD